MRNQDGFTLVEMSIVLVIIGLIVGGILAGQEIVNDGRIKIQVAQIDALKSATASFHDQFVFYPGDYKADGMLAPDNSIDGNEDGIVDNGGGLGLADTAINGKEMDFALQQMQLANLITGVSNPGAGHYVYQGKLNGSAVYYGDFIWPAGSSAVKSIRLQALSSTDVAPTPAVRTSDAISIDGKYDDGLPLSGSIFASQASSGTNCCSGAQCSDAAISTTATYGTSGPQNATNCVLIWQIQ